LVDRVMTPHVLGHDEKTIGFSERGAVDAARRLVVDGRGEQVLHALREGLGTNASSGSQAREQAVVDAERDTAAASRRQDPLGRQGHRARELDVGAAIDRRDLDLLHVGDALDDLLHPEIADDEGLQLHRRAQQREESLAVDVEGQRLLANDLARGLLGAVTAHLEVRSHRSQILAVWPAPPFADQYTTRINVRPPAGAVAPAFVRSRLVSTSLIQAGPRVPRPMATALPTMFRTM